MKTEEKIKDIIKGEVLFDEPLSKHTSFKIGGPAEILVRPEDVYDLQNILKN